MTDSISFKFNDLQTLADKLQAFGDLSTVWPDDDSEYKLTIINNMLTDGSITRDFKIEALEPREYKPLTFNDYAHRETARQFKAGNGVMFTVRILRDGDKYGLNDCLTWGTDNGLPGCGVEFYDARYPHTTYGQFVSRYYYSTLTQGPNMGLDLQGDVPSWKVDRATMGRILDWLDDQISIEG